jgi:hypothetical protein
MSKKEQVLKQILEICEKENDYKFHNDVVKNICKKVGFGNPFDVTKLDNTAKIPGIMFQKDFFILHLGEGYHQFVKGIKNGFHEFEDIDKKDIVEWKYRKSLLNEFDTSESNILSVGINQHIIHDFLYEDIIANPKVYSARRTKATLKYKIGNKLIETSNLQMEIDLTMEFNGVVTIFEGKNDFPKNFAIYQLYHPFLYYQKLKKENRLSIDKITCCYLLRKRKKGKSIIRIYNYTFAKKDDMSSIKLLKARQYNLIQR